MGAVPTSDGPARPPAILRYVATGLGAVMLALALGYAFGFEWATSTWPWPDGRLSYLFVGSILAAVSVALIWTGATGEWGVLPAGALAIAVMSGGMALYLFLLMAQGREGLAMHAVWFAFVTLVSIALFFWGRRFAIRDVRPVPRPVRVSFVVFLIALLLAATALILQAPSIFPWELKPESSVMFGWMFMGNAANFLYTLFSGRWHAARSPLVSFLAYDLVLIAPFVALFSTVKPGHVLSLVVYIAVLAYSGALAVYYLFIDRRTRGWAVQEAPQHGSSAGLQDAPSRT